MLSKSSSVISTSSLERLASDSNSINVAYTIELEAALLLDKPEPGGMSDFVSTFKVIFFKLKISNSLNL